MAGPVGASGAVVFACVVISSAFVMRNSMAFFECFSRKNAFHP